MKLLLFLFIILFSLCRSLPPYNARQFNFEQSWTRRPRAAHPQEPTRNEYTTTAFGYKIKLPKIIRTLSVRVKDFFVGPSGVITKLENFLKGNSRISTSFFGRKIDFQANVPLSKKEVRKSFKSFFRKFQADPMARVLFVMYLNIVVILVVFMALLAKHVQLSLQMMKESREKKDFLTTPGRSHVRTISPDVAMPATVPAPRLSPNPQSDLCEENTQGSSHSSKSIHWSPLANPSLVNVVDQETITVSTHNPPRLLNELEGILSPSKTETEPSLELTHRSNFSLPSLESTQPTNSTVSAAEEHSSTSPKKSPGNNSERSSQIPNSTYYTALESTKSSFDASQSQCLPTLTKSSHDL